MDGEGIEEKWQSFKETVTSTYKEVLGKKKYNHKEWMTAEETLKKFEERKGKVATVNNSSTQA